ncbi:hypothetical protein ACREYP_04990 [Enterobacter sp. TMH.L2]
MNTMFVLALIMGGSANNEQLYVIGAFPSLQECQRESETRSTKTDCFVVEDGKLRPVTEVEQAK